MEMLPNDVRQHRFRKGVRGFDTDEVDQFLEHVATVLEDALEARQKAEEVADRMEGEIARFRDQEGALKKAVLTVERAMESAKASGMQEVESIKRNADVKAREIIQEAEHERRRMEEDMKFLKESRQGMIEQIRAFCKAQLATLESLDRPDRTKEAFRQGVMPKNTQSNVPPRPPAPAVSRPEPKPAAAGPKPWTPEKVERENVDAQIADALSVEEAEPAVSYPPPLVPDTKPTGDR